MENDQLKITSQTELCRIVLRHKKHSVRVGLLCGCFDILHIGHVRLFKFAKTQVDILVVGLDSDFSIRATKGENRPIHTQAVRMEMLAGLSVVDYVFPLIFEAAFGSSEAFESWTRVLDELQPDVLFTCPKADMFHVSKRKMAEKLGIEFQAYPILHAVSTTYIEKHI